jgi:hypothetical protein
MQMNQRRFINLCGIFGIFGSLLMFAGDMLLYGHFGSGREFETTYRDVIQGSSTQSLVWGGVLGPIATVFYLLGFYHIYIRLRVKSARLALIIVTSCVVGTIFGGSYHAMWTIRALLIKAHPLFSGPSLDSYEALYGQIITYTRLFYSAAGVTWFFGGGLLLYAVLAGKSRFPRWTALVNPALIFLLSPLAKFIPAPIGLIVVGGYINIVMCLFFVAATVSTWSAAESDPYEPGLRAGTDA